MFDAASGEALHSPEASLGAIRALAFAGEQWLVVARATGKRRHDLGWEWYATRAAPRQDSAPPPPLEGSTPQGLDWQRSAPKWARKVRVTAARDRVAVAAQSPQKQLLALGTTRGHILLFRNISGTSE